MLEKIRRWWRYGDKDLAKYLTSMILGTIVICVFTFFLASQASSWITPVEHRFDDGVRCYTMYSSISCVAVR